MSPLTPLPTLSEDVAFWLDECLENASLVADRVHFAQLNEAWQSSIGPVIGTNLQHCIEAARDQQLVNVNVAESALDELRHGAFQDSVFCSNTIAWHLFIDLYGLVSIESELASAFGTVVETDRPQRTLVVTTALFARHSGPRETNPLSRWLLIEFCRCAPGKARARHLSVEHPDLIEVALRICDTVESSTALIQTFDSYARAHIQATPESPAASIDPRGRRLHPLQLGFFALFLGLSIYQLFFR